MRFCIRIGDLLAHVEPIKKHMLKMKDVLRFEETISVN